MAECGKNSVYSMDMVQNQNMDYSDFEVENYGNALSTENRFWSSSGRGSGWKQRRQTKRKKVSSTDSTDNIDIMTFSSLGHDDKLSFLFEYVTRNTQNEVHTEQTKFNQKNKELNSHVDLLFEQVRVTERAIQHQANCMKMLAYKSIDIEAKSRRNNVIIWGVSERSNVKDDLLVMHFFEDEMAIDTSDIVIDSAKRIGMRTSQRNRYQHDPKRPILIRLRDLSDTERVMKKAYKLKGTQFGIDRDYPREIAFARRELYQSDEARKARINRYKLQIRYPAKLYINGSLVCDKFPEWEKYLYESRISCFDLDTNVDCEISSSSKSTISNKQSETAYHLDTDDNRTSETSEEEQRHDCVITVLDKRDKRCGSTDAITISDHLQSDQLSFDSIQTNNTSRDRVTRSGKHKVKPLPESLCSPRKTSEVKRKYTHTNKYSTPKCVIKNVKQYENKYFKTSHESNTHTRKCINQPVVPSSKSSKTGKPQDICNWYGDVGLIASDDCDTQL